MSPSRANMPALPPIVVIGPGRVGTAISTAATVAGLDVDLADREGLPDACAEAEVVLLCVPDGEIATAAAAVIAAAPRLRMLGHTSGATGLDVLAAAPAAFSVHPLQTIPDGGSSLVGAPAAIEGSTPEATALARDLAEALGMKPFELPPGSRAAYHAAASMASNFLVALEESAAALLRDTGLGDSQDARELLAPLVLRTAANWAEQGAAALTGPIARGDEETVARPLGAIPETAPELEPLYRELAARTRALASEGARA